MKKYKVEWSKTYYTRGTETVEAESEFAAEDMVRNRMGDLEGSLQWNPDEDTAEAWEENRERENQKNF